MTAEVDRGTLACGSMYVRRGNCSESFAFQMSARDTQAPSPWDIALDF